MRLLTIALSLAAPVAAQFPCSSPAVAPWAYLTCPCSTGGIGGAPLGISFQGTGRIGSLQRVFCNVGPSVFASYTTTATLLAVGTPSASPIPLPPGLVVCDGLASVPSLHIDAVAVFAQAVGLFGNQINYYLFIPADPSLVGVTVAWQGFAIATGFGSPPLFPSMLLGLTIQP